MRRKLHPLSVHLGMAVANIGAVNVFAKKCGEEITADAAVKMMRGIQAYQQSTYKTAQVEIKTEWKNKKASLINLKENKNTSKRPLILVPSLINKSHIFNLSQSSSVLKQFHEKNVNAYILDWGTLDANETIETLIHSRLNPALQHASDIYSGQAIDVLGYCMGGTLILSNYDLIECKVRRIVALAAPWDFKDKNTTLSKHVRVWSPLVLEEIKKRKTLPAEWIQALFASIEPQGSAKKFITFSDMDQDSFEAQKFITVEDWLNDGVDLPKAIAHKCIQSWFIENELYSAQKNIDAELMIVASKKDKLVPYESAIATQQSLNTKSIYVHEAKSGHIGLIVGRNAEAEVWKPIRQWLAKD